MFLKLHNCCSYTSPPPPPGFDEGGLPPSCWSFVDSNEISSCTTKAYDEIRRGDIVEPFLLKIKAPRIAMPVATTHVYGRITETFCRPPFDKRI